MPKAAILEKLETINQASGALEDLELVAALAKTVLGRIAEAEGGKDAEVFLVGHGWKNRRMCLAWRALIVPNAGGLNVCRFYSYLFASTGISAIEIQR